MFGRLILGLVARRVISRIARNHGDVAGTAIGAALAGRRTRALGIGGAVALTAYEMIRNRRAAARGVRSARV